MTDRREHDPHDANQEHAGQSAADLGHGTHGRGDARERLDSNPPVETPTRDQGELTSAEQASEQLANGQWGSAAAGGSVIDKRAPEKKE